MEETAEALVLRRSDSGENDRRLTLLARGHGRTDVVAKGARKGGSRLAGSSEPLIHARFSWHAGRNRRFITSVQPITSFPGLRADYDRLVAGLALAEVLAWALPYNSPDDDALDLALGTLASLAESGQPLAALSWGLAHLLRDQGHGPDWMTCAQTGQAVKVTPVPVSPSLGGPLDRSVFVPRPDVIWVPAEALMALQLLTERPDPPRRLKGAEDVMRVLIAFWEHHIERPLPTLESVLAAGPDPFADPI